ncbi:hypothetical protein D3C83_135250 [compost metagenome]
MAYGALVVGVVVEIAEGTGPEPAVPAWGDVGVALVVAVEVLAEEAGSVARRIEARCHVVLL